MSGNSLASKQDERWMEEALKEAQKAYDLGEVPIGAVLVMNDEIVARAFNRRETWKDATAHAEVLVIRQACEALSRWRLSGATLYVTIEPCPMCAGALVMSRIDRLVYGSSDSKAGGIESLFNIATHPGLNHQVVVTSGVKATECAQIMKDFFQSRRKK